MKRGEAMKRILMVIAAAATLALSTLAAPAPAHAQRGVAAGIAAGLIGGAIVGGAIASAPPPPPYYGPGPAYYDEPPPSPAGCYWEQRRFWDGYAWNYRPVRVCY